MLVYAALICPLNKQHSFRGGDILETPNGVLFIWSNEFCCFIKAKTKLSVCVVSRPISPLVEKVWVTGGDQNNSILLGHKIPAGAETQSLWESKNWNQSSVCLATILCAGTARKTPAKLWAQNMSESEGQVNWEKWRSSGHQTAGSVEVWLPSFLFSQRAEKIEMVGLCPVLTKQGGVICNLVENLKIPFKARLS